MSYMVTVQLKMSRYIIGIDGGGTKTLGVLYDIEGNEIDRVTKGFSTLSVDEEKAIENIIDTIDYLYDKTPKNDLILHIQMGIAGASKLRSKAAFLSNIELRYKATSSLVTDAELALNSIPKNDLKNVIMVLGGTGSVVIGKNNNQNNIIGGFGHLLGDEGSGYHLAISALKDIISQYEQGENVSELSAMILKEIHADDHFEIKDFVYNNKKSDIAVLSLFISKKAIEGNLEAIQLFKNEGKHLARQTYAAYKKIDSNEPVIIYIRGGFLLNAPYVKETMFQTLQEQNMKYEIFEDQVEPIVGAYNLGLIEISKR